MVVRETVLAVELIEFAPRCVSFDAAVCGTVYLGYWNTLIRSPPCTLCPDSERMSLLSIHRPNFSPEVLENIIQRAFGERASELTRNRHTVLEAASHLRLHRCLWARSRELIFAEVRLGAQRYVWAADQRVAYVTRSLSAILGMFAGRNDLIAFVQRITLDESRCDPDKFAEDAATLIALFQKEMVQELDICSLSEATMQVCAFPTIRRFRMRDIYVSSATFASMLRSMPALERLDVCHCTITDDRRTIERVPLLDQFVIETGRHRIAKGGTHWNLGLPCRRLEIHSNPSREEMEIVRRLLEGAGEPLQEVFINIAGEYATFG